MATCDHPRPKLNLPGYTPPRFAWQPPAYLPTEPAALTRALTEAFRGIYAVLQQLGQRRTVVPLLEDIEARAGQVIVGVGAGQTILLPEGVNGELGAVGIVLTDVSSPVTLVHPDGTTTSLGAPGAYDFVSGIPDAYQTNPGGTTTAGDGLSGGGGTPLSVDVAAIAGAGLESDGSNNLRIAASAAGAGLTGGAGSALAVGAGDGISVAADAVAVSVAALVGAGIEDDGSNNFRIAASVAGAGLTGGGGSALAVGAGTGITVNANDVAVTTPLTDGDKGDITVATNGTAWTIDAGAVTPAKLAAGVVLITGTVTAAALASDTTRLETSNNAVLQGISGGTAGRVIEVYCGGNHTLQVDHNAAVTAGSQILLAGAANYGPVSRGGVCLMHDGVAWRQVASASLALTDGDKGDVTVSSGGTVFTIDNDAVTDAKLRNSAALSVIGRSANSSGDPADIAAANDAEVLRRSGTTLGFGTVATAGLADDAVTDAKLRESAACSVIGRSANSTGNPADITGGTNDRVLARSSDSLAFQQVATAMIADDAVTDAKLRNSAAVSVIGRSSGSSGSPADIAAAANDRLLARTSNTLSFQQLTAGMVPNDLVTDAMLRDSAALSVIGRASNSSGDPSDIAAGTDGHVLRRSGTTLGFGTVVTAGLADDAVTPAKLSKGVVTITGTVTAAALLTDTTRLETSGNTTLQGVANGFSGRRIEIYCGGNHTLQVDHSATGTAANNILLADATTYGPITRGGMVIEHDGTTWREVACALPSTVSLARMASLAQSTIIGRAEGAGTGVPTALTPTQVVSIIDGESPTWTGAHAFDGEVELGHRLRFNAVINPTITANQNNYSPTGWATANVVRIVTDGTSATTYDITGAAAGEDGEIKYLLNLGPADIRLQHEHASSTAANRFRMASLTTFTLDAEDMAGIWYDGGSDRWRVMWANPVS